MIKSLSKPKHAIVWFLLLCLFSIRYAQAATITSTATGGQWATGSTWVGGVVPAAGDAVIIATTGTNSVSIAANMTQTAAGSVTVNNGAILNIATSGVSVTLGSVTVSSGGVFTIKRNTTILGTTNISGRINFGSTSNTIRTITFTGAVTLNSGAIWDETNGGANAVLDNYVIKNNFINNATTFTPLGNSPHNFTATGTLSGTTNTVMPTATFTAAYTISGTLTVATLLTVTTVTLTNNGTITATASLAGTGGLTQGATGILNIGGASSITTLTATAAGNTVNYTGGAQTIHTGNYSNLNFSGSGAKTLQTGTTSIGSLTLSGTASTTTVANLAITNNLTINTGTSFTTGATFTQSVGGTTSVTGSLVLGGTGAKTFTGDVILNTGSVWNESGIATVNYGGSLTNNATTFTANTGAHNFTGASKTISGSAITSIPTATFTGAYAVNSVFTASTLLTITGVTVTNNATITASTSLTGTGTLSQGASGILNIGAAISITTLSASTAGNIVNYTGVAQTGLVTTYSNLTLSGSGLKSFSTAPTVNTVLSMEGTATISIIPTYGSTATLQYNTATARTAGIEWITPFVATGGIVIKNTGAITTPGVIQMGNNTNVPLNINAGATLTPGANLITFHGDFINAGTLTSGSGGITIAGTVTTQSIDDFTTTGAVTLTKTAGTATLTGNVNGAALTINGSGGTLNLGVGLTHTFTGIVTLTAGTLNGGSSTLNENAVSATAWTGTGTLFVASAGSIIFGGAGNQTIAANSSFYNLGFAGSGTKTFSNATTINNNFSISGTAVANLGTGLMHSALSLTLSGTSQAVGSWGSTASSALNKNATWFGSTATGILNINCSAPIAPTSGGNKVICSGASIPTLTATVGVGQVIDWYNQASGGTLLSSSSSSYTPSGAGTYYAETRVSASGCLSATRTAILLTVNPLPTLLSLSGNSICSSPDGNGTISSTTSVIGINYQLYNSSNTAVQAVKAGTGSALIWSSLTAGNGYYVIGTNATTGCASTSSTVNITTIANPTALILTGSSICTTPGGDGTITSSTSQIGVNYQLYNSSNVAVQVAEPGTGAALTWDTLSAANGYYVKGTNTTSGCISSNSNTVNVSAISNPIALVLTGSTICASPGGDGTITSTTSVIGVDYQLNDNAGNDIGSPISGTGGALTFTAVPAGTGYFVDGFNTTTGCASPVSNSVDVVSAANPTNKTITVTSSTVCTGSGTNINVAGSLATETYQLRNNAGNTNIGSPVTGNGGSISLPTGNLAANTTFNVLATRTASGCTTVLTTTPTVTITPINTAGSASSSPTLCINTALTAITHTTTGATGIGSATGLPTGVTASWSSNTITISGTPSAAGAFTYSIPLTGGCGSVTATGTINVTAIKTVGAASSSPTLCINTSLTSITHTTTGATGIGTATGLPSGVTAAWASNTITISGTPTTSGTFNYSIPLTGGCGSATATGTITVTPATVASVSISASISAICSGSAVTFTATPTNGGTAPAYQWKVNGNNVGSNSATFTSTTLTNGDSVTVEMTSNATPCLVGSPATSNAVVITVHTNPTITLGFIDDVSPLATSFSMPYTATAGSPNQYSLVTAANSATAIVMPGFTAITDASLPSTPISVSIPQSAAAEYGFTITVKNSTTGCSSVYPFQIMVTALNHGVIGSNQTVCTGTTPAPLTNIAAATGAGTITYTWEKSTNSAIDGYSTIVGETGTSYAPGAITQTTYFKRIAHNQFGDASDSDPITITVKSTTWTSGAWTNGAPDATTSAIISDAYVSAGSSINACSLTINNSATVVISSGDTVNLSGALIAVPGSLVTFNNNANLIQGGTTNQNSGAIIIKRNSSALKRQDYTIWSSPVANQQLLAYSPQTLSNRFYTYNTNTNLYDPIASPSTTNFDAAKGYLIRMPNNHPTTATIWTGQFAGVPNNGNYSFPLVDGGAGNRFNLVGNPYPSPLDLTAFISNATNTNSITGTLYFWRKTNNAASPTYCVWNLGGFVGNGELQVFDPNDVLQVGQGFFVEGTGTGSAVVFDNSMRVNNHANQFFKSTATVERNRIWLNATNADGLYSQTMVGYVTNATQEYDPLYDGKYINTGEISLTSLIGSTAFAIQSRALPFADTDVVPLSFKATNGGNYTISLDHVDGLFLGSQGIYLRDNLTGTVHDLNSGAYNFISEAGNFDTRFELVYQPTTLGVVPTEFNASHVILYKDLTNNLIINTGSETMASVKVFDLNGKLLVDKKDINSNNTAMNIGIANEVVVVQIISDKGITVTKKFLVQRVSAKEEKFKMVKVQVAEDE